MEAMMEFITGATYQETILNMLFLMMALDGVIMITYAIFKGTK